MSLKGACGLVTASAPGSQKRGVFHPRWEQPHYPRSERASTPRFSSEMKMHAHAQEINVADLTLLSLNRSGRGAIEYGLRDSKLYEAGYSINEGVPKLKHWIIVINEG
ncbi:unnamed protein product [Parnassius apollo]|uniref:(apollo) hypothetical protein n=1 Tax=Parnassius apollo TaxID=110799 RepID=A0A8S3W0W2_PARAO|nr:unnamed protein product [Parnassius apollo]